MSRFVLVADAAPGEVLSLPSQRQRFPCRPPWESVRELRHVVYRSCRVTTHATGPGRCLENSPFYVCTPNSILPCRPNCFVAGTRRQEQGHALRLSQPTTKHAQPAVVGHESCMTTPPIGNCQTHETTSLWCNGNRISRTRQRPCQRINSIFGCVCQVATIYITMYLEPR